MTIPTSEGFEIPVDWIYFEANNIYSLVFVENKGKMLACRSLKEVEGQF